MHFTKMHGLGNDYLYVYGEVPKNVAELSVQLSDRHFGACGKGYFRFSAVGDPEDTKEAANRLCKLLGR